MTLGFSTQINGKPNCFIEKTWRSITDEQLIPVPEFHRNRYAQYHRDNFGCFWDGLYNSRYLFPKRHTIREDASNRWRPGMYIHFAINNRTKNRFQFAPVLKCVSVQEIEIIPVGKYGMVKIDGQNLLFVKSFEQLAINDGFDSVEDFFAYFNKDFKGKIIHWTNLKY